MIVKDLLFHPQSNYDQFIAKVDAIQKITKNSKIEIDYPGKKWVDDWEATLLIGSLLGVMVISTFLNIYI
jgi:hypothetical protein